MTDGRKGPKVTHVEEATPRSRRERRADGTRARLGELLVALSVLDEDDLITALADQAGTGRRIGDILVERRLVSAVDIVRALAQRYGVEFVDLDDRVVDPSIATLVKEAVARRHQVLPIEADDTRVIVAMVDPGNIFALDDLRSLTGREPVPLIADAGQLADAIDRIWGAGDNEEILRLAREEVEEDESALEAEILSATDDAPVIQFVNQLITRAINDRVSDLHLEPSRQGDVRVRFRIDGVLVDVMRVPKSLRAKLTSRIKIMANINIAEKRLAQDGRMSVAAAGKSVSIRVVTLPTPHGEAVVMRILEESTGLLALAQLGFHPGAMAKYDAIYRRPWGAILVTGPTGSGKSTTLYATLAEINDPGRNIVTVEDPIEYQLDGIKQIQLNPKAGMSFPVALRSILRADPDVVLVGEIRDVETARIATEAALTGHLMLSSLHTNTAASAPMRLVDMGIEPFLVTSTIIGVVGQRLARRLCDRCKEAYEPSRDEVMESFGEAGLPPDTALYRPVGCLRCSQTGYRGRIAIQEVLPVTDELHPLILGRASAGQIEAAAVASGMVTMREDGLRKAVDGLTSVHEVFRAIG